MDTVFRVDVQERGVLILGPENGGRRSENEVCSVDRFVFLFDNDVYGLRLREVVSSVCGGAILDGVIGWSNGDVSSEWPTGIGWESYDRHGYDADEGT